MNQLTMPNTTPPAASLPRSVRWFAPWTWRRRWQLLVVGLLPFAYLLSSPLTIYTFWKLKAAFPDAVNLETARYVHAAVYAPVPGILERCPPLARLHEAELRLLITVFGLP